MQPGRPSLIDRYYPDRDSLVRAVRQYGVRGLAGRIGVDPSSISKRLKNKYGRKVRVVSKREIVAA